MYKKKLIAFLEALEIENINELLGEKPIAFTALGLLMKKHIIEGRTPNIMGEKWTMNN